MVGWLAAYFLVTASTFHSWLIKGFWGVMLGRWASGSRLFEAHVTLTLRQQVSRRCHAPNSGVLIYTAVITSKLLHSLLIFLAVTRA
jgi:hypothetical protein